jgi:hypothetical protein
MVLTKYKTDETIKSNPKQNISISEWMKDMAEQGFYGTVVATNHDGTVYKGELILDGEKIVTEMRRVKTQEELKNRLQELKNKSIV